MTEGIETEWAVVAHVPQIVDEVAGHARPVVLIDGRSGSGKTTLARALAAAIDKCQLVRLDDFYPGWDGLAAGSAMVVDSVLRADAPGWRSWDWELDRPGTWHPLDPTLPLVIEGCGALSRASRALATFGVWVELDAVTRRARALARDGDAYAPHWERWAAQEEAFLALEDPRSLADLTIDERARGAQPQ
ncbi:ATP-binding protein [Salinibacterium sp. SYSU T00001]|uniref:ATP-binding protein n=1 Tax=Homoserinimonas sedimenticola TaxID=2986805 RepID=UPI002235767C|nr:ATP-binding protein [Salinibacterium sedimenticola]MCW4384233.1 ATP-binding protein [Salinibacterium sedimenticola]